VIFGVGVGIAGNSIGLEYALIFASFLSPQICTKLAASPNASISPEVDKSIAFI
jgi:hypothetical protein